MNPCAWHGWLIPLWHRFGIVRMSNDQAFQRTPQIKVMSTTRGGAERRQFGRRKTSLHAWISVPGRPKLSCTVVDLSVGGALLQLQKPSWLPYNFMLTIEATRFVTSCEVRHSRSDSVGVRFLSAVEAAVLDSRGAQEARSLHENDAWTGNYR